MTGLQRIRRSGGFGVLLLIGVPLVLSGCAGSIRADQGATAPPPVIDRTTAQVTTELGRISGVTGAFVSTGPVGLPNQRELSIGLDLETGYAGDTAALLDYALAMAWSATTEEPTTTASAGFLLGDTALDLAPVAADLGWSGKTGPTLELSIDEMAGRYGPWPGPVPEKPAALG
jgi:hypothetical protein